MWTAAANLASSQSLVKSYHLESLHSVWQSTESPRESKQAFSSPSNGLSSCHCQLKPTVTLRSGPGKEKPSRFPTHSAIKYEKLMNSTLRSYQIKPCHLDLSLTALSMSGPQTLHPIWPIARLFRDYENLLSKLSWELELIKQKYNHSLSTKEVAVKRSHHRLSFQKAEETARQVEELTA